MSNSVFSRLIKVLYLMVPLCFAGGASVSAQDYEWAPDYPVGSTIPTISAPDQHGETQTFDTLTGQNGLVLAFNRSFDWCPYCKAQLAGLAEVSEQLQDMGLSVVAITYDSVETLNTVAEDMEVDFTLLHDEDVKHVNAFGIRNMDYEPGEFGYGIPEPGIMLVDEEGVIQSKFAEEDYRERPDWSHVVEAAASMTGS